jgi:hypothetical protein
VRSTQQVGAIVLTQVGAIALTRVGAIVPKVGAIVPMVGAIDAAGRCDLPTSHQQSSV